MKVNSLGVISTLAGRELSWGYSGDGGAPTAAQLNGPIGIAVSSWGEVYIADKNNFVVRKV